MRTPVAVLVFPRFGGRVQVLPEFRLKNWNMVFMKDTSYCSKVMEELWKQAKERSALADVTLKYCGTLFHTHSCLLAVGAPGLMDESGKKITIKKLQDISPDLFEEILHFLYSGQICIPDEHLDRVVTFAERYKISELLNLSRERMKGKCSDNADQDSEDGTRVTVLVHSDKVQNGCLKKTDKSSAKIKRYQHTSPKSDDVSKLCYNRHSRKRRKGEQKSRVPEKRLKTECLPQEKCEDVHETKAVENEKKSGRTEGYECHDCGRRYKSRLGLQVHIDTVHLQKFLHKCEECGRRFSQRSHLNDHMRVHSKERKHVCSFCGMALCTKINLKRHESTHTGIREHNCIKCDKTFAVPHDLKRHMRTQHSSSSVVCELCGKPFSKPQLLKRHKKKEHTETKKPSKPRQASSSKTIKSNTSEAASASVMDQMFILGDPDVGLGHSEAAMHSIGPENTILAVIQRQSLIHSMWKDKPIE